jgi:hypothetical protein
MNYWIQATVSSSNAMGKSFSLGLTRKHFGITNCQLEIGIMRMLYLFVVVRDLNGICNLLYLAKWDIDFGGYKFIIKPTSFKHVGLFPEQLANWDWMKNVIEKNKKNYSEPIQVLNLFGYTGGATLACADAGAEVTHVDGSKTAVAWARENAELSNLADKPIRWIIDDCIVYLKEGS